MVLTIDVFLRFIIMYLNDFEWNTNVYFAGKQITWKLRGSRHFMHYTYRWRLLNYYVIFVIWGVGTFIFSFTCTLPFHFTDTVQVENRGIFFNNASSISFLIIFPFLLSYTQLFHTSTQNQFHHQQKVHCLCVDFKYSVQFPSELIFYFFNSEYCLKLVRRS